MSERKWILRGKFLLHVIKFVTTRHIKRTVKIVNVVPLTDFVKYHAQLTRRRQSLGDVKYVAKVELHTADRETNLGKISQ